MAYTMYVATWCKQSLCDLHHLRPAAALSGVETCTSVCNLDVLVMDLLLQPIPNMHTVTQYEMV